MLIRRATVFDVDAIMELGQDPCFSVSDEIHFYERKELLEWCVKTFDNILCVAEVDKKIIGFYYCKIFSYHWAMLDNFYVLPEYRGQQVSEMMLTTLKNLLKSKQIQYLSILVDSADLKLLNQMKHRGFTLANKEYQWLYKEIK